MWGDIPVRKYNRTKYNDAKSKQYLAEIRVKYEAWKAANIALIGPSKGPTADDEEIIKKRVAHFNEYKDFIDQQIYAEQFDSRSNLHSSALEEFMYYLFKDIVADYFFIAWNNADRTRSGYVFLFAWKASLKNAVIFKAKPSIFTDLSSGFHEKYYFYMSPSAKIKTLNHHHK